MVIPGISIACFAASSVPLIPICPRILPRVIFFPGYGAPLIYHISDLLLDSFSLLLSIVSIELEVSVYVTHLMSSLFCISLIAIFIAVISAGWMEVLLVVPLSW